MPDTPPLLTVGELARRLSKPVHTVEYLIASRGLKPASRAGNIRVFTESDLQFLASVARRNDAARTGLNMAVAPKAVTP